MAESELNATYITKLSHNTNKTDFSYLSPDWQGAQTRCSTTTMLDGQASQSPSSFASIQLRKVAAQSHILFRGCPPDVGAMDDTAI